MIPARAHWRPSRNAIPRATVRASRRPRRPCSRGGVGTLAPWTFGVDTGILRHDELVEHDAAVNEAHRQQEQFGGITVPSPAPPAACVFHSGRSIECREALFLRYSWWRTVAVAPLRARTPCAEGGQRAHRLSSTYGGIAALERAPTCPWRLEFQSGAVSPPR